MDINYAQVERDWLSRGFSWGIWTDSPGQIWADFVHDTDELVMLIEGEMELTFQGKTIRPHIGEEILIPAGVSHTVINIGKTTPSLVLWLLEKKVIPLGGSQKS